MVKLIDDVLKCLPWGEITMHTADDIARHLAKNDVVKVVRCKDCKHWLKDVPGCTDFVGRCKWANYMVGAAGYCVYGERKE